MFCVSIVETNTQFDKSISRCFPCNWSEMSNSDFARLSTSFAVRKLVAIFLGSREQLASHKRVGCYKVEPGGGQGGAESQNSLFRWRERKTSFVKPVQLKPLGFWPNRPCLFLEVDLQQEFSESGNGHNLVPSRLISSHSSLHWKQIHWYCAEEQM